MRRSYLKIRDNNYEIFHDPKIENAEALIISQKDFLNIFSNFLNFKNIFDKFIDNGIKIFINVDDEKELFKNIDNIDFSYINGFYLKNPNKKIINKLSIKSREIESLKRIEYKSLKFFISIDNQSTLDILDKIIKNQRVDYISVDEVDSIDYEYYKKYASKLAIKYHKIYIQANAITSNLESINDINSINTPSIEAVNESLKFINEFNLATKKDKKQILQSNSLTYHYQILKIAKKIGLIDDYPVIYFTRNKTKEKLLKKPLRIKKFYTLGEEIGNAISHGLGIILSIVALIMLLIKGGSTLEVVSYVVFSLSSLILYTSSTLYHSFALGRKTKALFQKFDHISIYLLIAGTYTPFSLVLIGGTTGIYICIFLWFGAISGLLLNVFAFGRFRALHMLLYVALGWVAVLFMPQITANLSYNGVMFLIIGGVMYTVGIIFYGLKLFKFTHMVWHIFTVLGTIAHFITILLYL